MSSKKIKRKRLKKKLLHKHRLVVLNEDTFEENFSFKLSRLNVFVATTISAIVLIVATTLLIAFTPLREYIPGYSSTRLKKKAHVLQERVDSLQYNLAAHTLYVQRLRNVLTGDITIAQIDKDSLDSSTTTAIDPSLLQPNKQDSILRETVALEDKYNIFEMPHSKTNRVLFPPVKGNISQEYNLKDKHFAIDVVAKEGTAVKAVADGTVIFADWTTETGFVLIIEHALDLISVYKHNAVLHKSQGDLIKAGEVIATVGNTGSLTTGAHLHFELWSEGYPVNPTNFIDFD